MAHAASGLVQHLGISEQELQTELKNTRRAGGSDLAEGAARHIIIRRPEIDVIKGVEELGAELYRGLLRHSCVFEKTEVSIEELGASQDVLSRVAKSSDGVRRERGSIEPLLNHIPMGPAR